MAVYFQDIGVSGLDNIRKTIERRVRPSLLANENNFWGFPYSDEVDEIFQNLRVGDYVFLGHITKDGNGEMFYACEVTFVNNNLNKKLTVQDKKAISLELWGESKYNCIFSCKPKKLSNFSYLQFTKLVGQENFEPGRVSKCENIKLPIANLIAAFS